MVLTEQVQRRFPGDIIFERSLVQQSQANGVIEFGIRAMGNHMRVMKIALQRRLGEIGTDHIPIPG